MYCMEMMTIAAMDMLRFNHFATIFFLRNSNVMRIYHARIMMLLTKYARIAFNFIQSTNHLDSEKSHRRSTTLTARLAVDQTLSISRNKKIFACLLKL